MVPEMERWASRLWEGVVGVELPVSRVHHWAGHNPAADLHLAKRSGKGYVAGVAFKGRSRWSLFC